MEIDTQKKCERKKKKIGRKKVRKSKFKRNIKVSQNHK